MVTTPDPAPDAQESHPNQQHVQLADDPTTVRVTEASDVLDVAAEWLRLTTLAEAAKAEQDTFKSEAAKLEARLIEEMVEREMPNITVAGRTVHVKSRVAANKRPDVATEDYYQALRDAGLEDFIKPTVSASAIAGYAREVIDAGETIPDGLAAVLNVHIIETLGHTRAAVSKAARRRAAAG